ncbi:hypothetical protein [Pseudomonas mosselii]|uniref:hypothetical protein n=1 Tax=Pseudomonas mosselii TaxID=78327 RepID=UPI0021DADA2D|nr:hypothetical protein [Pseudomonas mosselii]MCU9529387.1 hypothetical protein [Pseudomonas mosselii]MCU9536678.1 hypothetical protein [Pseudomonas mosselii]MCU9542299.1 hypothetical protein [Pseudomonas mosselii]MCU9548403.1 hypothetical protein [Pseudomonas mosselii]
MLNPTDLSFQATARAYRTLLAGNADRALTFSSFAVVLLRAGELHLALMNDGLIDIGNALPLTDELWDTERGCWSAHASAELTLGTVNYPMMVKISGHNICSFNVDSVRFTFEGGDIQDPTSSECGRFATPPSYYGFRQLKSSVWELDIGEGDVLQLAGDTLLRRNQTGDILGRVLISQIQFDFESDTVDQVTTQLSDALTRALHVSSGMIEYPVPSSLAEAVAEGFKLGMFEVIGNGIARITAKGRIKAQGGVSV